ncbi:hypothetical protein FACS1894199_13540 [Bacteroidia bacterium]|nr:hypothetical protein FACS1894199_13540 [Bacteroidia bacterium]
MFHKLCAQLCIVTLFCIVAFAAMAQYAQELPDADVNMMMPSDRLGPNQGTATTFSTLMPNETVTSSSVHSWTKSEVLIWGGGGLHTLLYKGSSTAGIGFDAGLGFIYCFKPNWGVKTGASFSFYSGSFENSGLTYNSVREEKVKIPILGEAEYVQSDGKDYAEIQSLGMLTIPLMLHYQSLKGKIGFYADIGAKVGIPMTFAYEGKWKNLTRSVQFPGQDGYSNSGAHDDNGPHDKQGNGIFDNEERKGKVKSNSAVFLAAVEGGMKMKLQEKTSLYLGAYLDYGLTATNAVNKGTLTPHNTENPHESHQSLLNATDPNTEKAHAAKAVPLAVGVKVAISFGLGPTLYKQGTTPSETLPPIQPTELFEPYQNEEVPLYPYIPYQPVPPVNDPYPFVYEHVPVYTPIPVYTSQKQRPKYMLAPGYITVRRPVIWPNAQSAAAAQTGIGTFYGLGNMIQGSFNGLKNMEIADFNGLHNAQMGNFKGLSSMQHGQFQGLASHLLGQKGQSQGEFQGAMTVLQGQFNGLMSMGTRLNKFARPMPLPTTLPSIAPLMSIPSAPAPTEPVPPTQVILGPAPQEPAQALPTIPTAPTAAAPEPAAAPTPQAPADRGYKNFRSVVGAFEGKQATSETLKRAPTTIKDSRATMK